MATDAPRTDLSTTIVVVGIWRNFVVTHWRARGSAADLTAAYLLQRKYLRTLRGKIVSLSVVPASVIRPLDPESRKVIDDAVLDVHPHTAAAALTLPASGFAGAIVRSLLTSINFMRRFDFPNKVLADIPSTCIFLAPYIDGAPTPAAVEAAYDAILAAPPTA